MIEQENEFKLMLTNEEYERLSCFLQVNTVKPILQTNYYYDTRDQDMRKKNMTVRVRRKESCLIGTIKHHLDQDGHSVEHRFQVDMLPQFIVLDDEMLILMGALETQRRTFKVCEGVTIMLDLNQYLDFTDFEVEIEFNEKLRGEATGVLLLLQNVIKGEHCSNTISKSERFFRRLKCFE